MYVMCVCVCECCVCVFCECFVCEYGAGREEEEAEVEDGADDDLKTRTPYNDVGNNYIAVSTKLFF